MLQSDVPEAGSTAYIRSILSGLLNVIERQKLDLETQRRDVNQKDEQIKQEKKLCDSELESVRRDTQKQIKTESEKKFNELQQQVTLLSLQRDDLSEQLMSTEKQSKKGAEESSVTRRSLQECLETAKRDRETAVSALEQQKNLYQQQLQEQQSFTKSSVSEGTIAFSSKETEAFLTVYSYISSIVNRTPDATDLILNVFAPK